MSPVTLTFSAGGCRWRVRRLCAESLPATSGGTVVTGLLFESDADDPRFLPLSEDTLPTDTEFAAASVEDLARYLSWASVLRAAA